MMCELYNKVYCGNYIEAYIRYYNISVYTYHGKISCTQRIKKVCDSSYLTLTFEYNIYNIT